MCSGWTEKLSHLELSSLESKGVFINSYLTITTFIIGPSSLLDPYKICTVRSHEVRWVLLQGAHRQHTEAKDRHTVLYCL